MRILVSIAALLFAVLPCRAQSTLREQLKSAGIPEDSFSEVQLNEHVDGSSAGDKKFIYFVFILRTHDGDLTGFPQVVRYDTSDKKLLRAEIKPKDADLCCGSPLGIEFVENYLLLSFHDNPSADTVLVTGKDLSYRTTLYGFYFHQIASDLVVYVENLIHFAAQHPERLAWADLRSGREGELYPPMGDRLRTAFAVLHEQHMPAAAVCQQANDPCDPAIYDEDIAFVPGGGPRGITVRVTRTGNHSWGTKNEDVDVPVEETLYVYKLSKTGWLYCEWDAVAAKLVKSRNAVAMNPGVASASCEPNLPVAPDRSGQLNPFWPDTRKGK